MPIATNIANIRAGIVTAIHGIAPSYEPRSSELWRPVDQIRDVPSSTLRSFFVDIQNIEEEGPVWGGCALHTAELRVWTSYLGLNPAEQQVVTLSDQQDLWRALHRAEIDGAPKFSKAPFEPENDEDGKYWGAHLLTAFLFLPLP